MAGRPFLEVIRNVDLHEVLRQTRIGDAVTRRELRLSTPVERRLQVNAVRLALGGDEVGVVMVLHDVTELRRLEQVRTEFIANVSHEVRTPLTAILGYLETLLAGALEEPEHARKFLEIVFRHTERLGRLLSDLTDLSNIELGKVSLRLQPTSLPDTVESVLTIIGPKAEAGEVALTSDVPRRSAPGARRPRSARPDPHQPRRQRGEVHAAGRTGHRAGSPGRARHGRRHRGRYGRGHSASSICRG